MDDTRAGAGNARRIGVMTASHAFKPERLHDEPSLTGYLHVIVGPHEMPQRCLWVLFLDADCWSTPVVVAIDDIPREPCPGTVDGLLGMVASTIESRLPGGQIALALERPGSPWPRADDVGWARMLDDAARRRDVVLRGTYLSVKGYVRRL
ncbi:MAG: hypothetical protein GEV10_20040 [Streptosporangiales bacterium]|nr:hypothetical protein [Streptosporangiales bacterium]